MSLAFVGAMPKDSLSYLEGSRELNTASWILSRRLRNLLREQMGVTYTAGAPYVQYRAPDPRYLVSIQVTTDPTMLDTTVEAVLHTVDQFRKDGPTDDELAMANTIRARQLETARQSNHWWINQLEVLDRIGMSYDYLEKDRGGTPLTRERIQAAANMYFPEKIYILRAAKPYQKKDLDGEKGGKDTSK
jgi:predicted Zn-dependent peptidase